MENLIKGASLIKEVMESESFLGMKFDRRFNDTTLKFFTKTSVHVRNDSFKEVVEDLNIPPCYVDRIERESESYPIELEVESNGIYFFTVIDEHEYEAEFREWHTEEPNIDEEFIKESTPRGVTNEEYAMRLAGHKLHDFM